MKKIPTTKEQVVAAWEKTREAANRLSDAKAKLEALPDEMPDLSALQTEIIAFRARHAEEKRQREADFASAQGVAKAIQDAGDAVTRAQKAFDAATRNQEQTEKKFIP